MYRVRVSTQPETDSLAPAAATSATVVDAQPTSATVEFTAPGDDGTTGTVSGYEVRYRVGFELDDSTFPSATPYARMIDIAAAGETQTLVLDDLAPATPYVVGIRAYDNCKHEGPLTVVAFETPTQDVGCGCTSTGDASGLLLVGATLGLLRRRRR
jgi:MYXO-CTERM domain-containing protein